MRSLKPIKIHHGLWMIKKLVLKMVYFISDNHGHIKIGVAKHVSNRIKELQVGNAYELTCVKILDTSSIVWNRGKRGYTDYDLELLFHQYFKNDVCKTYNSSSEWFYEDNILPLLKIESDEEMSEWIKNHLSIDFNVHEIKKVINEDSPSFLKSELDKKNKYITRLKKQIDHQKKDIERLKEELRETAKGNCPESIKAEFVKAVISNVTNDKIHYLIPKEKNYEND